MDQELRMPANQNPQHDDAAGIPQLRRQEERVKGRRGSGSTEVTT